MRSLNKGWIGVTLVILFGISLFFFRGSSRYSNLFNSDNFVANVSGTQISTTQFLRSLEMNIGQFAQMIGEELSGDQIRAFQIHQLVLQNLINNAIFENEFDNINFILDDSIIAEKTKKRFPNLYANNKINEDALNAFLRQQRLKIDDLVNIINYETRAVVFDNLFFDNNYPKNPLQKINSFNKQIRNIDLLTIPYDNIKLENFDENKVSKDDSELIAFFENNNNNYMTVEKRDISYIVLNKEKFKNNFVPTDFEIEEYFKNNKKLFTIPEQRSFKQFNFKSEEEAKDFRLKIIGLPINEIINFSNKNEIKFNDFENVNSNQVLEELSSEIFSLSPNEVSDTIKTTLAYHVIILNEITQEKVPSLNDVSDSIKKTLTDVQLNNFFSDLKSTINQQILDGFSLSELASKNNLKIKRFKDVDQNFVKEENIKKAVINSSFSQNKDFISDIIDFDNNNSFIINVDQIYPSENQIIEAVFNQVKDDFIRSKKIVFANNLFETSKSDNNLNKINTIFKLNLKNINLGSDDKTLPNSLINNIFDTKPNSITYAKDENNIYYAMVNEISIPNESEISENLSLKSEIKNAFGNEIIKTKNISLNDELINGLLSQYK